MSTTSSGMLNQLRLTGREEEPYDESEVRDIHALSPTARTPGSVRTSRETWDTVSGQLSSGLSEVSIENFTSMSREFNALVIAGSDSRSNEGENQITNLPRIGEDREEVDALAIVPDTVRIEPPPPRPQTLQRVKKEELETKINAWQTAKISKVNNRFKREEAIISGWESEEIHKANSKMKKVERKLEERRAKAYERMQNDIARAHRKSEEKRASAEAKRGTRTTKILELANLMRAVGKFPPKISFF
ncbi:hypothetical protein AMTRI_Chr03g139880 [Amborella trichopoda]|uniref:Remorin C-terminal domain-containing protein n=1 Tax=Amborella trichopoda TaxID=13333 RepID=W1NZ17_AMBTC|nr:remorin 4.1 [Amborella trichopoda]ERN00893.1 hypothetical protein AMTR_s00103p00141030 [Amborella trichopoda]|eukprot:XP_006838324.1 remorin 4.1 [Amborella trichopoda]